MAELVAAVDVGTGSARAGVFDLRGRLLGRAEHPLDLHQPLPDHAEQDSTQIWAAVAAALRGARDAAGVAPAAVTGLAFDATCSLVVRDAAGQPLSVSAAGAGRWDTLLWLDQRARAEATLATASGHAVVAHAGGSMSPEMQVPKLMWLKRRLPEVWARAGLVFDLADFLTWRATGRDRRSVCTLACKWSYLSHAEEPWPVDFLAAMGLGDLAARTGVGPRAVPVGSPVGRLAPARAGELGLTSGCRVAAGLIDAHAGCLGALGVPDGSARLALIAGTSSCVMALEAEPRFRPGIWGPYFEAILPGLWLVEGGQSASGALLDHVCRLWSGGAEPGAAFHARVCDRIEVLLAEGGGELAGRLHVLPDFKGNRSPLGDPEALGVISGLTLDASFDGLCRLYWRTAVGIALGLRQIVEHLVDPGAARPVLHMAGGHVRNGLLTRLYADATGCTVMVPRDGDTVLLGTAMAAAAGAGHFPGLAAAAAAMRQELAAVEPDPTAQARLEVDYRIFLEMQGQRQRLDALRGAGSA